MTNLSYYMSGDLYICAQEDMMRALWDHASGRLIAGIVSFIAILVASRAILPFIETNPLRAIVIWIPTIPAGLICYGIVASIRRMDEFQKRVQLEAVTFALTGALLMLVVQAIIDESPRSLLVFIAVLALWLVGWIVSRKGYA